MFAKFLPAPAHIENFKREAKARFFASTDAEAIKRNQVKFLDGLDMIQALLAQSDWSLDEQQEYLDELLKIDVWGTPSVLDDCKDAEAFLAALEAALDAATAEGRVIEAQCKAAGVPSPSEIEETHQWLESLEFTGTEKQVAWAKDIAAKKITQVHVARSQGREIPTSAKWWIENRDRNFLTAIR